MYVGMKLNTYAFSSISHSQCLHLDERKSKEEQLFIYLLNIILSTAFLLLMGFGNNVTQMMWKFKEGY